MFKNSTQSSDSKFGYEAGHLNPVKAVDPGPLYEISQEDYIKFICGIGYTEDRIKLFSGDSNSTCPKVPHKLKDLNYPYLAFEIKTNGSFKIEFHRRVKNVDLATSTFKTKVTANSKLNVKVVPEVLSFKSPNKEMTINATVKGSVVNKYAVFINHLV